MLAEKCKTKVTLIRPSGAPSPEAGEGKLPSPHRGEGARRAGEGKFSCARAIVLSYLFLFSLTSTVTINKAQAGGLVIVSGDLLARRQVLDDNGNHTWVEYDPDTGKEVNPIFVSPADIDDAFVVPAEEYNNWVKRYALWREVHKNDIAPHHEL